LLRAVSRPAVLAHRGASAYEPENSLPAFDLALRMGADVLEFDLRPTSDGELVALHDPTLELAVGETRELAQMLAAALEEVDPARRPPTLEAILARYGKSARYAIDMKDPDPAAERRLVETIEAHDVTALVEVLAFEADALERISRSAPALALVQLYRRAVPPEEVVADLDRAASRGGRIGRAAELVDAALMDGARARGLGVYAYVVNDEAEMERLAGLGVEGLVTDVPDRARAFLDRRVPAAR
jgi:glycerophosphoryl diester phosphodiesterase